MLQSFHLNSFSVPLAQLVAGTWVGDLAYRLAFDTEVVCTDPSADGFGVVAT
jgi:hypothetical protein